jgi:hypothetical protein
MFIWQTFVMGFSCLFGSHLYWGVLVYLADICIGVYLLNTRLVSVVAFFLLLCFELFSDTVSAADAAQVRMSLKGNVS